MGTGRSPDSGGKKRLSTPCWIQFIVSQTSTQEYRGITHVVPRLDIALPPQLSLVDVEVPALRAHCTRRRLLLRLRRQWGVLEHWREVLGSILRI